MRGRRAGRRLRRNSPSSCLGCAYSISQFAETKLLCFSFFFLILVNTISSFSRALSSSFFRPADVHPVTDDFLSVSSCRFKDCRTRSASKSFLRFLFRSVFISSCRSFFSLFPWSVDAGRTRSVLVTFGFSSLSVCVVYALAFSSDFCKKGQSDRF